MKIRITPTQAQSALQLISMFGTPAAAAHEIRVGLMAIRPYSDRRNEALLDVLSRIADIQEPRQSVLIASLTAIAQVGIA